MAEIPTNISPTVQAIYDAYESRRHSFRSHLGASLIGRECERELWFAFRWCTVPRHSGRMLRLFETGQREEERFIENLRSVGIEVHDHDEETGRQFRFTDFGGHFAGSIDGAALGIIEAPKTWHLLEFKTFNERRFELLKKHGVQITSPEHYAQVIIYMDYMGLQRAFYLAVNKNSDELYSERIKADSQFAGLLKDKARRIIKSSRPPAKISEDPAWWKCKCCDHHTVCHESLPPEVNCRTCLHSTPIINNEGGWRCDKHSQRLSYKEQLRGCSDHLYIPDLLPGEVTDAGEDWVEYDFEDGLIIRNGRGGLSSRKIRESGE